MITYYQNFGILFFHCQMYFLATLYQVPGNLTSLNADRSSFIQESKTDPTESALSHWTLNHAILQIY